MNSTLGSVVPLTMFFNWASPENVSRLRDPILVANIRVSLGQGSMSLQSHVVRVAFVINIDKKMGYLVFFFVQVWWNVACGFLNRRCPCVTCDGYEGWRGLLYLCFGHFLPFPQCSSQAKYFRCKIVLVLFPVRSLNIFLFTPKTGIAVCYPCWHSVQICLCCKDCTKSKGENPNLRFERKGVVASGSEPAIWKRRY